MNLNIGYIRSGNQLYDDIINEILCNMLGLPLDVIDEHDKDKSLFCLEFEDTSPSNLKI